MSKTVNVAKTAGFCFGVKRSVDRVFELAEKYKGCRLFTTGELIHNPVITNSVQMRGIKIVENISHLM